MNHSLEPRRLLAAATVALAAALGAACGGGTSQFDPFVPQRLFVFGDETSAFRGGDGGHYAVNGLNASGEFDCALVLNWVGQMASAFGFTFAECNPNNVADPQAKNYAARDARVDDVATQITAAQTDLQTAASGFNDKDLVAFHVGTNDIIQLYGQFPQRSADDLAAEARARGERAAQQVNRLVGLGAKVVLANLPDLGLSPFAVRERGLNGDTDRAALLSRLTAEFNQQLGVRIVLDGRFVGLAQLDQRTQLAGRSPASLGLVDVNNAVCTTAPPSCTTGTLVANADPNQWLWAGDTWLASGGQNILAGLAIDRARRNPF
jgi:hypothetical protein